MPTTTKGREEEQRSKRAIFIDADNTLFVDCAYETAVREGFAWNDIVLNPKVIGHVLLRRGLAATIVGDARRVRAVDDWLKSMRDAGVSVYLLTSNFAGMVLPFVRYMRVDDKIDSIIDRTVVNPSSISGATPTGKARVVADASERFDVVVFVDDALSNIRAVRVAAHTRASRMHAVWVHEGKGVTQRQMSIALQLLGQ